MIKDELKQAEAEIEQCFAPMQKQLSEFSIADLLLFFSNKEGLSERQERQWRPVLRWAEEELRVKINTTVTLDIPDNHELRAALEKVMEKMTAKEFCCWYAAALNLRSVLLGLALIRRKIAAQDACLVAALEEVWQNERWGEDEEALQARKIKQKELEEIESYLICEM